MLLIGLSGKIGVGKTVLARELCSRSENAVRLSFATALKQEAATRYEYDPQLNDTVAGKNSVIYHPDLPDGSATVREIF
jgi:deoxyadenosine/deoxycytidine kinase